MKTTCAFFYAPAKNGKQLYEYIQDDASEQISADEILKALDIKND